ALGAARLPRGLEHPRPDRQGARREVDRAGQLSRLTAGRWVLRSPSGDPARFAGTPMLAPEPSARLASASSTRRERGGYGWGGSDREVSQAERRSLTVSESASTAMRSSAAQR